MKGKKVDTISRELTKEDDPTDFGAWNADSTRREKKK